MTHAANNGKGGKKRIAVIVLSAIGAVLLIALFIAYQIYSPILAMKPAPTGEVKNTGILVVENVSNDVYVFDTEDGYILFDAGSDATDIMKSFESLGIDASRVRHVFLTHSDYDHVATLGYFPGAKIYMSQDELQMINGTTKRSAAGGNHLPSQVQVDSIQLLSDGETIRIGTHTVSCFKANGHTPGSMVYSLDGEYLFTGDAFSVSGDQLAVHPFTMDPLQAKDTIRALRPLIKQNSLVLTAHYGFFDSERL